MPRPRLLSLRVRPLRHLAQLVLRLREAHVQAALPEAHALDAGSPDAFRSAVGYVGAGTVEFVAEELDEQDRHTEDVMLRVRLREGLERSRLGEARRQLPFSCHWARAVTGLPMAPLRTNW